MNNFIVFQKYTDSGVMYINNIKIRKLKNELPNMWNGNATNKESLL